MKSLKPTGTNINKIMTTNRLTAAEQFLQQEYGIERPNELQNSKGVIEWGLLIKIIEAFARQQAVDNNYYPKEFVEWLTNHIEHQGMLERAYQYWMEVKK